MLIIGILGSSGKEQVLNSISKLFLQSKHKINVLEDVENISTPKIFKHYIDTLNKSGTKALCINILQHELDKGFYNDINFDIIAHTTIQKEIYDSKQLLKDMIESEKKIFLKLNTKNYVIINIDDEDYVKQLEGLEAYIITYGFNSKATITASSIDDNSNKLSICQQRAIKTFSNALVEPQEFVINISDCNPQDIYNALIVVTIGLICGIKVQI